VFQKRCLDGDMYGSDGRLKVVCSSG
jgi:hypothetical protein